VAVTLEVDEKALKPENEDDQKEKITKAIEIIHTRINAFGVAEPIVRAIGSNRIEIQLPGLNTKDNPEVLEAIKKPARLDFRVVHPTMSPGAGIDTPAGYEVLTLEDEGRNGETFTEDLFVRRIPEMSGDKISRSSARPDLYGKPEVVMNFTKEGRKRFAEVTKAIADGGQQSGRTGRLAIVLDGKLYSAPTVKQEIDSESAQISGGNMSDREAIRLANVLNNPLDLPLIVKEQYEVGPSLAKDAVDSGVRASLIGTAAVAAFMITFYTTGGLVAVATLGVGDAQVIGLVLDAGQRADRRQIPGPERARPVAGGGAARLRARRHHASADRSGRGP
jgi:SecD/SecF fusion protein